MATLLFMAIDEPDKLTPGRGSHPNSQNALSRRGKGRPALPKEAKRPQRNLSLSNDAWNGLLNLAQVANLSVSKMVEVVAVSQRTFTMPLRSLVTSEVGLQLNLTIAELIQLPTIEFVCRINGIKRKSTQRKAKAGLKPGAQTAQHTLTLSAAGWSQLEAFAQQQNQRDEEIVELIGRSHPVLAGTLYELTSAAMVDRLQITPAQLMDCSLLEILRKTIAIS